MGKQVSSVLVSAEEIRPGDRIVYSHAMHPVTRVLVTTGGTHTDACVEVEIEDASAPGGSVAITYPKEALVRTIRGAR